MCILDPIANRQKEVIFSLGTQRKKDGLVSCLLNILLWFFSDSHSLERLAWHVHHVCCMRSNKITEKKREMQEFRLEEEFCKTFFLSLKC